MRILVEVIDAVGVEERGAALDTVDLIITLEQKLRETGTVLAGDAGNERDFDHEPFQVGPRDSKRTVRGTAVASPAPAR